MHEDRHCCQSVQLTTADAVNDGTAHGAASLQPGSSESCTSGRCSFSITIVIIPTTSATIDSLVVVLKHGSQLVSATSNDGHGWEQSAEWCYALIAWYELAIDAIESQFTEKPGLG